MKLLTDNYIKDMRRYLNKAIIRCRPAENGEFSFMEKVVFLDEISSRKMVISWENHGLRTFSLGSPYLDENWVPLEKLLNHPHPEYASLEGKFVKREPNSADSSFTRTDFYKEHKYVMLTALETHLFLNEIDEKGYMFPFIIHCSRDIARGWILDSEFN